MAAEEQAKPKPDYEPPAGAETTGQWTGGAKPLDYTATAKWLVIRKKEKPSAEIFSVSYVAEGGDHTRPVAFVFNGGPGASSAFLHMGAVGPQRVDFPADGTLPGLPPKLVQNESSWLAFADLVFVDPVGTGFSRIIEPDKQGGGEKKPEQQGEGEKQDPDEYFGQNRDLESLCEFMSRWLSENDRWSSPVFIAGESYGGYRVGRLVRMLQEQTGIGLNGAILISPALELDRSRPGRLQRDHLGRPAADDGGRRRVPRTLARLPGRDVPRRGARRSGGVRERRVRDLPDPRRPARGVRAGAHRSGGSRTSSASRSSSSCVPRAASTRSSSRASCSATSGRSVGFYDVTITGTDPFPDRLEPGATPDPTLAGIAPAYTAAVNHQLRSEIGVQTDREYRLLSLEVNQAWKEDTKRHFFAPPEGATDSFRYGMSLNPHMKAFLTHGRYDMATPYYASDRLRNLMRLDPDTTGRLTVRHFEGGHMFYAWEDSRHAFTAAIAEFVAGALAG